MDKKQAIEFIKSKGLIKIQGLSSEEIVAAAHALHSSLLSSEKVLQGLAAAMASMVKPMNKLALLCICDDCKKGLDIKEMQGYKFLCDECWDKDMPDPI